MLRKCHGHDLTKKAIIQIFYHGLDESTLGILDGTSGGIFLYKTPNQAFQLLEDKVLFQHDWSESQNKRHRESIAFTDGSNINDNSLLMEKLEALERKMDSHFQSLKELQEIRYNYKSDHDSKTSMNDDLPMCERHEANYIQLENQNSHDQYSRLSHYEQP